jgi:hypothetical protein
MLAFADDAALARLVIAAGVTPLHIYRLEAFRSRGRGACPCGLERSPDAWYPADQVHHRRHYSMPPLRRPRRGPKPDRRRALELLAGSGDGYTEALMLAHGFTVELMVDLCIADLAIARVERMVAGGRTVEVVRLTITDAGRQALAES